MTKNTDDFWTKAIKAEQAANPTHRELNFNGIDGSGNKVYAVITTPLKGRGSIAKFDTESEARNWLKWA